MSLVKCGTGDERDCGKDKDTLLPRSYLFNCTELCDRVVKQDTSDQFPWQHSYVNFNDFKVSSQPLQLLERRDPVDIHSTAPSTPPDQPCVQDDQFLEPALTRQDDQLLEPALKRQNGQFLEPALTRQDDQFLEPALKRQGGQLLEPALKRQNGQFLEPALKRQGGQFLEPALKRQDDQFLEPALKRQDGQFLEPALKRQDDQFLEPALKRQDNQFLEPALKRQDDQFLEPALKRQDDQFLEPALKRQDDQFLEPALKRQGGQLLEPALKRQDGQFLEPALKRQGDQFLEPALKRQDDQFLEPALKRQDGQFLEPALKRQDDQFLEPALKRQDGQFLKPILKRQKMEPDEVNVSSCGVDVPFSQRSEPLTQEDWETVFELKTIWHSGGGADKTALYSHMTVLFTATTYQVKEICCELELGGLTWRCLKTVCADICHVGDKLGYTNSLHILTALLLPKFEDVCQASPRFLMSIMSGLSKQFPRQIVDGIIIPRLENSHIGLSEIGIFCKMAKENFTESNRIYLFKRLLDLEELYERAVGLFQILADMKIPLEMADLSRLVLKLREESLSMGDNLTCGKLLFALVTKYGNQMDTNLIEQIKTIAVQMKTFLKNTVLSSLVKLEKSRVASTM